MELVVVGAAGRTGRLLVEKALENKHSVTALLRDPAKLPIEHERLSKVRADVFDVNSLTGPLAGKEAVVIALGVTTRTTTTVFSEGARNVIAAARAGGVRRLVTMSSAGLETKHLPAMQRFVAEFVVDRVYRNIHLDLARMEDEVEASPLDWTIVRVPMLTDGPATPNYQAVVGGHIAKASRIARANVADYIVTHLDDTATYGRRVEVAN
ncbi:NAD(P)-dependent oxidoreductase [Kitasatospora purpeofusca]|uniref:NAD(P)-dependent oxidoreductase n=1 Tax=Kitasatospora purpeofusca TaxID=67352 RepID=UPI002A5A459B|nr:NAD(P)H-binding protein [Kitasatospora purpeofusca]MDY0813205.1 NAD(P)H-binding protein [Kitasatospora purpeofusca]